MVSGSEVFGQMRVAVASRLGPGEILRERWFWNWGEEGGEMVSERWSTMSMGHLIQMDDELTQLVICTSRSRERE